MADAKMFRESSNNHFESNMIKLFDRIGFYLNPKDVNLLRILTGTYVTDSDMRKVKCGKDLLLAIANNGYADESNFLSVMSLLRKIKRHDLLQMIMLRDKTKVSVDPVEEYLKRCKIPQKEKETMNCDRILHLSGADKSIPGPSSMSSEEKMELSTNEPPVKRLRRSQRISKQTIPNVESEEVKEADPALDLPRKYTCDVRLRVRAEYCNYHSVLNGNVSSFKADPIERHLECFSQASAILRARDLGYIVCDIKFSEITYLDAFWRDYLNGSLLEALKGVFITENLKQAVGNEAIKLLVNVDESDYEKGRLLLMKNLSDY